MNRGRGNHITKNGKVKAKSSLFFGNLPCLPSLQDSSSRQKGRESGLAAQKLEW